MDDAFVRARLQLARRLVAVLCVVSLAFAPYLLLTENPVGAAVFGIIAGVYAGLGVLLRLRPHAVALSTHVAAAALVCCCLYLSVTSTGGLGAPVLFVLPLIPIVTAFLLGRRATVIWGAVAAMVPVLLWVFRAQIPPSRLPPESMQAIQLAAPMMTCLTVMGFALAYARSVTEQQAELREASARAQDASRAKSAFLASMSHEIRTPLGGILGLSELLAGTPLSEEQAKMVALLDNSGRSLLSLLNDVLDFSRVEAGALSLELRPLDLRVLTQEVTALLGGSAVDKGIALQATHHGPAWVLGDALRLRQVLLNLVSNAIKFTPSGSVSVRSATIPQSDGRLAVEFSVQDTGIGIPMDVQERLFEPFTQADEGVARVYGGSGLGLAIVSRLAQRMGGQVQVDSRVGHGARFVVNLSLQPCEPVEQARIVTPTVAPGLRVLLADDNTINQQVFVAMLRKLGCEVEAVGDGLEAVERALSTPFDLLLLDCQMPRMGGVEVTRVLRGQGYTGRIVALSADVTPESRGRCAKAGMDAFLPKPLSMQRLAQTLSGC